MTHFLSSSLHRQPVKVRQSSEASILSQAELGLLHNGATGLSVGFFVGVTEGWLVVGDSDGCGVSGALEGKLVGYLVGRRVRRGLLGFRVGLRVSIGAREG